MNALRFEKSKEKLLDLLQFDHFAHANVLRDMRSTYKNPEWRNVYQRIAFTPKCDFTPDTKGSLVIREDSEENHHRKFPGGPSTKFDSIFDSSSLLQHDKTAETVFRKQAVIMTKSLSQSILAAALSLIPPRIGPPIWNFNPLPCLPLPFGKNCFGAVLYPITFADLTMADVTDDSLDGAVAQFPRLFAKRVGTAPDSVYTNCYHAYMSMYCSSSFPMCTAPQGYDIPLPGVGKVPLCIEMCQNVLIQCPGFRVKDIEGPCDSTSSPPVCAMAYHTREDRKPSQFTTFDQSEGFPTDCPPIDVPFLS